MNNRPGPARLTYLRKLHKKKYRDEFSEFIVENPLIVRDALRLGSIPREIFMTKHFKKNNEELVISVQQKMSSNVYELEDGELQSLATLEQPQGIIAIYDKQDDIVDDTQPIVFLNGVADPANVGAIMRSCAAFGVATIITDEFSADPYNPKAVSAAKESLFSLHITRKTFSFFDSVKKRIPVFSLEAHAGVSLESFMWPKLFCLVVGSEAHGVDKRIHSFIDTQLTIRSDTKRVESLNVSVATAIALYSSYKKK